MALCPCDSKLEYEACCEPFHTEAAKAPTALALMRARYSAHVKAVIPFIMNTIHPDRRKDFDEKAVKTWAEKSEWKGFEVIAHQDGSEKDSKGQVEFIARYRESGELKAHHELAQFEKVEDSWYFVDGQWVAPKTYVREEPKIGRNDPCHCGSGKKFKKCHGLGVG